ncbi:MAG: hypothetical protein NTZ74_11710 [Chloroflexi bacterium]|nr:hypothetical protein [Chloroflexota bacterium]
MKILEALASENIRVSKGSRWLIMEKGLFYVYEQHYRKVTPICIYEGIDEETAVQHMLEGEPETQNALENN